MGKIIHPLTVFVWLFGMFLMLISFFAKIEGDPIGFFTISLGITFFCGVLTILVERLKS